MTNVDETLEHARKFHYKMLDQLDNVVASMATDSIEKTESRLRSLEFAIKKNLAYMQSLYEILIFNVQHANPTLNVVMGEGGNKYLQMLLPLPEDYTIPTGTN